jgi:hypothetical protein
MCHLAFGEENLEFILIISTDSSQTSFADYISLIQFLLLTKWMKIYLLDIW